MVVSARIAASLVALVACVGLVACGGDDGAGDSSSSKPKQSVASLARQAFGPNPKAARGRIDGHIDITVKGARGFGQPVRLAMSGPFRARKGRALPDYAIDLSVGDQGVGLSSVRGRSFVSLGTTGYEIPARNRERLARSAARGHNGLTRMLEQFGIAPWRWETNKRIGATERIGGVQTVRVDTGVDVGRFLRDANVFGGVLGSLGLAHANGLPSEIPPDARRALRKSVKAAKGASWIATSDKVMRKAGLTIDFAIPASRRRALGGISSVKVVAQVLVTEVGARHQIERPTSLAPFSSLAEAFDALADSAGR
jgi:hypothetical protein